MRIRSSFLVFVVLIGLIVLGFAGALIRDAYTDRSNALTAKSLSSVQGELMRLNELLSIERGADNAALLAAHDDAGFQNKVHLFMDARGHGAVKRLGEKSE